MKITQSDVTALKDECKRMYDLCQALLKSQSFQREPLFSGYSDYVDGLSDMHECPDRYFVFRCFDCFVQVVYHRKLKKYGLYLEGCYSTILNPYERLSSKSYILGDSFDSALQLFSDVCVDVFHQRFLKIQDGLY